MKNFWILKGIKIALIAAAAVVLFSYITMALWNWLVPDLFHGPEIKFVQAIGLLVLAKILFRSPGGGWRGKHWGHGSHHWRKKLEERMAGMTPEEREKFRHQMRRRCGYGWENFGEEKDETQPSSQ